MTWRRVLVVLVGVVMALPSYLLEIAFGIDPRTEPASGDWVDISSYLEEGTISRGQSSELERFQAGTMDVTLNNEDRKFEPDYAESPYYPNVELDQHIRLRAVQGATTYDVYRGFVSDWDPEWRLPNKARVSAIDAFRYFQTRKVPSPYAEEVLADSPTAYYRFGEGFGSDALDSSGNGYHGTYHGNTQWGQSLVADASDKSPIFDAQTTYVSAPSDAVVKGTGAWTLEFVMTTSSEASTQRMLMVGDWTINQYDFLGGQLRFEYFEVSSGHLIIDVVDLPLDGERHHIVYSKAAGASALTVTIDGTERTVTHPSGGWSESEPVGTSWTTGLLLWIGRSAYAPSTLVAGHSTWWKGGIDEVAVYMGQKLSLARIQAHHNAAVNPWGDETSGTRIERVLDDIDWPAGLRDIDAGDSTLQMASDVAGESALEHMQRVEASEFGGFYMTGAGEVRFRERSALSNTPQVTIGRDTGQLPYVEIKPDRNESQLRTEVRFARVGGLEQVASASNRFFDRSFSRTNLMNTTDEEVATLAATVLNRYQIPLTDYTVLLNPRADDALWAEVFGRELEDAVMVSRIPATQTWAPFTWDVSQWDATTLWGAAISKAMRILGIKHDFGKGFTWKTTWKVSPV